MYKNGRALCLLVLLLGVVVVVDAANAEGLAAFVPFVTGGRPAGECEPAYPTVCLPSPPPDLNCPQIPYNDFPALPPDPHRLDADKDGIACESPKRGRVPLE